MKTLKLGYSEKWLEYEFITEAILSNQITVFEKSDDITADQFRFASFQNWLDGKEKLSDKEISNYLELALDDKDKLMAGSAVRDLFVSPKISERQFGIIKGKLPQFGDWTKKLITREVLSKRLNNEDLDAELFKLCLDYKEEFRDNRLLFSIIEKTDNTDFLQRITELEVGKRIKTSAQKKLNQINR